MGMKSLWRQYNAMGKHYFVKLISSQKSTQLTIFMPGINVDRRECNDSQQQQQQHIFCTPCLL